MHRDYDCVITEDDEVDCEAAHLVPKIREDVSPKFRFAAATIGVHAIL